MSAIEDLAKRAAVPELPKPLVQMNKTERVNLIVSALNRAGQALHTRIPAPAWTADPMQRDKIIESQTIVYAEIKARAEAALNAALAGKSVLPADAAITLAGDVFADLLWAMFYGADYGMLPMVRAMDRGVSTPELDEEYLYRLASFQAIYKIAESTTSDPLAAQYNQILSTQVIGPLLAPIEIGWKALCFQPYILATPASARPAQCKQYGLGDVSLLTVAAIVVVALGIVAILAWAALHLYEVHSFNKRWKDTCQPMPTDPELAKWCQETGAPPPSANVVAQEVVQQAFKYGALLLGGYLVVQFLPRIVERVATARKTAKASV